MYFLYEQTTGKLYDARFARLYLVAAGYSGKGIGLNNPDMQSMSRVGPVPQGVYDVHPARDHPQLGPAALRLKPWPSNEMFGRSAFLIHGDNRKGDRSASEGCIVVPRTARNHINGSFIHGKERCFLIVRR